MRYLAKPKMNNSRFDKEFNTEKESVNYLEKETGLEENKSVKKS